MTDYTDPYNDRRAPQPQGWHMDKKVPISLILTLIMLAIAGMSGYSDLKREVALMQADLNTLHRTDEKQADVLKDSLAALQGQFLRMESKLDRLIERKP